MNNFIVNTKKVEISESEDKDYLDVKFVICDFNPNANNVKLNRDTIDNWLPSLVNKPIVGKIQNGNFTTHQYKNGQFGTDAFGVFTSAYIETLEDGNEYIVAEGIVWKRFEKACSIISSKISRGQSICSSWEVSCEKTHMEDGVKVVDEGVFLGHCMLGTVRPAYECSKIVDVAEQQESSEFTLALSEDMKNLVSQQLVHEPDNEFETKYLISNYNLKNGVITVSEPQEAKKEYVLKEEHDKEVSSLASEIVALKEEISSLKVEISEKDGQIIKLGETMKSQKEIIEERDNLIAELEPVKVEMERLKAEKEARELAEKQEALRLYVSSTKFFTDEEIESSEEMKNAIAELDEAKVNSLIAQKVISEAVKTKEKNDEDKKEKEEDKKENKKDKEEDKDEDKKENSEISSVVDIKLSETEPIRATSIADILGQRRNRF